MSIKIGQEVYVHDIAKSVLISKIENGTPTQGKYMDDKGQIHVVDLVVHAWEIISIVKKIWAIIKEIFKK